MKVDPPDCDTFEQQSQRLGLEGPLGHSEACRLNVMFLAPLFPLTFRYGENAKLTMVRVYSLQNLSWFELSTAITNPKYFPKREGHRMR